jgi:hypothetical protein
LIHVTLLWDSGFAFHNNRITGGASLHLMLRVSKLTKKEEAQQGLWEMSKSRAAFRATIPSGSGNPRFARIPTGAAFSIRP